MRRYTFWISPRRFALTRSIAVDLAATGITPDEFERVIEPRRVNLMQVLRSNPYWLGNILSPMQVMPSRGD